MDFSMDFKSFCEAHDYGPIPAVAGKDLWKNVKLITGIPFKNKRFTGDYAAVRDEAGGYELAISNGLLVLQTFGHSIPNFKKLVEFLKKHFGDVHTKGDEYINCRKFGEEWREPTGSVEVKGVLNPLPPVEPFLLLQGKMTVTDVAHQIDAALRTRKVNVEGHPKLKLVSKLGDVEKLVSWEGHYYIYSISTFYQVKDINDARHLVRLMDVRHAALRQAEVSAWKHGDFSNPMG
jgi:hypothetical protein